MKRLNAEWFGYYTAADDIRSSSFRVRLQAVPPLEGGFLDPNQIEVVTNLKCSFKLDSPRALIQNAIESGKTIAVITAIGRLIKYGARRLA